ncbi:MAG TPA: hypothetical protein VJN41_08660 [Alphaproteobacteria bacterium]|nr:hypothetical protein [Alphaproteobacteria bacterium]
MPEPSFSMTIDDDLPRTIRREREARERETREREDREQAIAEAERAEAVQRAPAPAATVVDVDVPFGKLMFFFIKAVFAAVPALIVLTAMLWLFGQGLQSLFPQLLKLKILIYVP